MKCGVKLLIQVWNACVSKRYPGTLGKKFVKYYHQLVIPNSYMYLLTYEQNGRCDLVNFRGIWRVKSRSIYFVWMSTVIVRRAGLLWSQQDFEWRWSVPLFKCLTVLEFSFILFDLCLLITFFNFIMNYVPIVTFWIFTYHKIWILSIMFCFIWSYWIIYFLACLEVSWRVVS